MCDFASIAMAAFSAAGSFMQQQAQEEAADRQQDAINAQLEQQDNYNRQAEQKGLENADEYKIEDRTKRFEEARQDAGESLAQNLIKSREEAPASTVASGRLSAAFDADRATKQASQLQDSLNMARLMGNMNGTRQMLGDEAITNANYASDLNTIGRNARGSYSAAQPGIQAAGQVDGGSMALGGLMQGVGSAIGSGALSGAFNQASSTMTPGSWNNYAGTNVKGIF